jgi:hypothetical protein
VAGNPCSLCTKGCCNAEVMSKLQDMAFGQDDKCCYKEASSRVRAAAENALNACKNKTAPTTAPLTPIKETPIEAPRKEVPIESPPAPKELPVEPSSNPRVSRNVTMMSYPQPAPYSQPAPFPPSTRTIPAVQLIPNN